MSNTPETTQLKMSREDVLYMENLALKVQVTASATETLQKQMMEMNNKRIKFQEELIAARADLSAKYGVDLTVAQLMNDGTIVMPAPSTPQTVSDVQNVVSAA